MPASKELFKKYLNPIFIETGSHLGEGIQFALDAGFKMIFSIELFAFYYFHCVNRFKDNDNVHLIHGDSSEELGKLLSMIKTPVTFWLDAHHGNDSPLLTELDIIKQHYIKTHTLLIDDLRDWTIAGCGFDTKILKNKISEINPDYAFTFADGFIANDILIAKI